MYSLFVAMCLKLWNKSKQNIFLNQKVDFTTNNREDLEYYFILQ